MSKIWGVSKCWRKEKCTGSDSFVAEMLTLTIDLWYVTRFAEFLSDERRSRLGIIASNLDKKQPWSEPEPLPVRLQSPPLLKERQKTLPSPKPPPEERPPRTPEMQKHYFDKYYQHVDELYASSSQELEHAYVTSPFFPSPFIFDNPFESVYNPQQLPFNPSPYMTYSEPVYTWQNSSPPRIPSNRLQYGEYSYYYEDYSKWQNSLPPRIPSNQLQYGEYSYYYEDYSNSNRESFPPPTRPHTMPPSSSTQLHDYFNIFTY